MFGNETTSFGYNCKQHMRSRLFEYWFSSYQMKDKFILMPVSIEDMEGIENFAALIIRKDNPNVLDIVAEFSNTVAMFRVKPNSHDQFLLIFLMGLKVFTTPSVPLTGDRNPSRKGKDVTALQGFFSKIIPSFLTLKEGSTSHPDPLTLREEGGNRYALRLADQSGLRQIVRDGTAGRGKFTVNSL